MRTDQEFLVQALDPEFVVNWQVCETVMNLHNILVACSIFTLSNSS